MATIEDELRKAVTDARHPTADDILTKQRAEARDRETAERAKRSAELAMGEGRTPAIGGIVQRADRGSTINVRGLGHSLGRETSRGQMTEVRVTPTAPHIAERLSSLLGRLYEVSGDTFYIANALAGSDPSSDTASVNPAPSGSIFERYDYALDEISHVVDNIVQQQRRSRAALD